MTPFATPNAPVLNRRAIVLMMAGALLAPMAWQAVRAAEEKKSSDVSDHMDIINDNLKKLRRSARTKNFNDASQAQIATMIQEAQKCREMTPPKAEKIKPADKAKFVEGYKKEMDGLIAAFKDVEKALKEKRNDDAAKQIEKLNNLKKQGHDKYVDE